MMPDLISSTSPASLPLRAFSAEAGAIWLANPSALPWLLSSILSSEADLYTGLV